MEMDLDRRTELDRFLREVERRALRTAEIQLRDPSDALDAVQDSMLQLVRRYGTRPATEWGPLFHRILKNRIHDCQRRRRTRNRIIAWWTGGRGDQDEEPLDPIEGAESTDPAPGEVVAQHAALDALEGAVAALPPRQREAFLLRTLDGLDTAATAARMGCSEGSVKTHYFRALAQLRERLGDHV
jgi:RNA polymerase sigma-70 factor, ECF subfamily